MDDIISRLSAIEDAAVSILDDINTQQKKLADDMQEKTEALDTQIQENTENIIAEMKKTARLKQNATIEAKRAHSVKVIVSLQEDYEKNHKTYVDKLFAKITKE